MLKNLKEQRRHNVEQMLASWAIEGFTPDQDYLDLLDGYVEGRLTTAVIGQKIDEAFGAVKDCHT